MSPSRPVWRRAHSSLAFFWFPDDPTPYNVSTPSAYPPGALPSAFTLFLDFNKNHQRGGGGPRSITRAPPSAPFCCLLLLFEFLLTYPPLPDSPLLSGALSPVTPRLISALFSCTAITLGLDPSRLVPHSLRSAAICQMIAFDGYSEIDLLTQGDWETAVSLRPYAHTSLSHAARVTPALYDPLAHPLAVTQLHFSASPSF